MIAVLIGVTALGSAATANETLTYSYDALGRLVKVARAGTVNNNASECYAYDPASNRSNVTDSTTGDCGAGGGTTTLTLSPTTLPNGTVGTAYSKTITATGGTSPYSFVTSAGALPAGLTLTSGGVLSGTPTTATSYSFTVKATDSAAHTGSQAYSVTIASSGGPPITANFDNGGSVSCGGNTVEINVVANDTGGVPPLSLVSASGATVVSSTDVTVTSGARAGTQSFTYVVKDSAGSQATGSGSITVTSPCQ